MLGGPKRSSGGGPFWTKILIYEGGSMAFSLPSMPLRDCNFRLKQFVRIKGTRGACPTYSFGDGGHDRGSLGPKWSLEVVFFG